MNGGLGVYEVALVVSLVQVCNKRLILLVLTIQQRLKSCRVHVGVISFLKAFLHDGLLVDARFFGELVPSKSLTQIVLVALNSIFV